VAGGQCTVFGQTVSTILSVNGGLDYYFCPMGEGQSANY
jgi:hypothetical protein